MITITELLSGQAKSIQDLPKAHRENLTELCRRMNIIRTAYGKPMIITSGYRSLKHHLEIYAAKGITDQKKIPMMSRHLIGYAADTLDRHQELQAWCLGNVPLLKSTGIWIEDFSATPTWVHMQIVPPASGKRFFKP